MTPEEIKQRAETMNTDFPISQRVIPAAGKPNGWKPIFKMRGRGDVYPSSPKVGCSKPQLNLIYMRLQDKEVGVDPDKAVFYLDNREDGKIVGKTAKQFTMGDAADIIIALKRKKIFNTRRIKVEQ